MQSLPSFGGEPLGALLDPVQHLPFHDERCGLHRKHPDPRGQRRKSEAVAADQPCLAVVLARARSSRPSCRLPNGSRALAEARRVRSACGSCRSRACRRPEDADSRAAPGRRCACRVRAGSRSSRRCRRRRGANGPICAIQGQTADAAASIVIARVATPSASSSSSSPGRRALTSASVAPQFRMRCRSKTPVHQSRGRDRTERQAAVVNRVVFIARLPSCQHRSRLAIDLQCSLLASRRPRCRPASLAPVRRPEAGSTRRRGRCGRSATRSASWSSTSRRRRSSSRPHTGVGTCGTSSRSRRAQSGSSLSRRGLSTASATSGMTPSRQRRTS